MIELDETMLRKIQAVELDMLAEFDRICRKHNIIYSIDGGTLLGAIRHGGFIPWDDDADVIMVRSEYEKFLAVVDDEINKDKFCFQDMFRTNGYRWGYGKLRRKDSLFVRENQQNMPYEQGIFMDVFVCDNVPDNYLKRAVCNFTSFIFRKIFYSPVGKYTSSGITKMIYRLLDCIPLEKVKKAYKKYISFRNKKNSSWVKCLTFPACNKMYGYKRYWYEDTTDILFENIILKACKEYDEYLSFLYGDYMTLPPPEKRKIHPVTKIKFPE